MLADRVDLMSCVKGNVCAAEREQSRHRGRESDCRSSRTELDREDCVPCEILISFFAFAVFAVRVELFSCVKINVCAAERQPHRRRGSKSDCKSSHTELKRRDSVPCES